MNQRRLLNGILIAFLMIFVGIVGYLSYGRKSTTSPVKPLQRMDREELTKESSAPSRIFPHPETESWKTYRNEKYRVEIRYPASLHTAYETTDLVLWRYPQDSGYVSARLMLRKEADDVNLRIFIRDKATRIREIYIERDKKIPVEQFGAFQKTAAGLEYTQARVFDFEDGGWFEVIYFESDSVILSLTSRLKPEVLHDIINSISLIE